MKRIMITTTALLLAGVIKVNAQMDSTVTKTDNTITTTDTSYSKSVSASSESYKPSDNVDKDRVHLGVRAGVNSSNLIKSGDVDISTGAKLGFNAAVFLEIPIIPAFSIQPEVQFSQKGYKASGTYLTIPYEYKLTSNFIEVPLLAKFKPSKNFGILIGPQFSFLTSTETKYTLANTSHEQLVDQDNSNLRKNVLGGVVGIEAAAGPIVFDLRYSLDFQKNNGDGSSTTPTYRNQVIALSAGIRF